MKALPIGLLFFLSHVSFAQTSADWWYFGYHAGVHFTPSGPAAVTDSEMKTTEGCASISDAFGNLLFYTRGDTVWDASHNVMLNGTGLSANGPGGDGAMNSFIVPRPNDPSEFYLFTIPSFFGGLFYSRIDMDLNGGLGAVDLNEKNIPLVSTTPEMVTCVRQPNNIDYWVIALKKPGDSAFVYAVTESGVATTPVISHTGLSLQSADQLGYLKGSQQNDKLAMTIWKGQTTQVNASAVHLFDIDNATGSVQYDLSFTPSQADTFNYGVEFSPNGQFLYVQSMFHPDLRQYDLSSGVAATISASEEMVGLSYTGSAGGALQLGPDGKIYVARNTNFFLASVEFPNSPGALCGYNHDAVHLSGKLAGFGLPQFAPFFIQGEVLALDGCFGDSTHFFSNYLSADSVFWSFGDPGSGVNDTSTATNPSHVYSAPGTYTVTHIAFSAFLSDTTLLEITIKPRQSIDWPTDTVLCAGDQLAFDLEQEGVLSYLWHNGSTEPTLTINDTGLIRLGIVGVCDTIQDSMRVLTPASFVLELGPDTVLCGDSVMLLNLNPPIGYQILWSNGATVPSISVDSSGHYEVVVWSECDTLFGGKTVSFQDVPRDSLLPRDTILCVDGRFFIERPISEGFTYQWYDGSASEIIQLDTTGVVWLEAFNDCGRTRDSMLVVFNGEIKTELGEDTIICSEDQIKLFGTDPLARYLWITGDNTDTILTEVGETRNYVVTITLNDCQTIASRKVIAADSACEVLDCDLRYSNVFTPNGDGMNDVFRIDSDCDVYSFDMAIYNRWGQLVHYSRHIGNGWDGHINGQRAEEGTYFFTVTYKDFVVVNADRFATRGSFTLVR